MISCCLSIPALCFVLFLGCWRWGFSQIVFTGTGDSIPVSLHIEMLGLSNAGHHQGHPGNQSWTPTCVAHIPALEFSLACFIFVVLVLFWVQSQQCLELWDAEAQTPVSLVRNAPLPVVLTVCTLTLAPGCFYFFHLCCCCCLWIFCLVSL